MDLKNMSQFIAYWGVTDYGMDNGMLFDDSCFVV